MTLVIILALVASAAIAFFAMRQREKSFPNVRVYGDPVLEQPKDQIVDAVEDCCDQLAPESTPAPEVVKAVVEKSEVKVKEPKKKKAPTKKQLIKKDTKKASD